MRLLALLFLLTACGRDNVIGSVVAGNFHDLSARFTVHFTDDGSYRFYDTLYPAASLLQISPESRGAKEFGTFAIDGDQLTIAGRDAIYAEPNPSFRTSTPFYADGDRLAYPVFTPTDADISGGVVGRWQMGFESALIASALDPSSAYVAAFGPEKHVEQQILEILRDGTATKTVTRTDTKSGVTTTETIPTAGTWSTTTASAEITITFQNSTENYYLLTANVLAYSVFYRAH